MGTPLLESFLLWPKRASLYSAEVDMVIRDMDSLYYHCRHNKDILSCLCACVFLYYERPILRIIMNYEFSIALLSTMLHYRIVLK